jgi:hypothetical protein
MVELIELPSGSESTSSPVKRYLGTRAAWLPGSDLFTNVDSVRAAKPVPMAHKAAFGGHVYAQAALAMCRAKADARTDNGVKRSATPGLHVC